MPPEQRKRREILDRQGDLTDLEGFAGRTAKEQPPIPQDLTQKDTKSGAFYGKTKDPEELYDKRRVIEEG